MKFLVNYNRELVIDASCKESAMEAAMMIWRNVDTHENDYPDAIYECREGIAGEVLNYSEKISVERLRR